MWRLGLTPDQSSNRPNGFRLRLKLLLLLLGPVAALAQPLPDDGQWTMPARNYQGTRYSGLDQINTSNAKNLKVAWTFSTGVTKGHEAAPLVVGDTMYVVTPYPNYLYALDLKNAGATKWKYEPQPASADGQRRQRRILSAAANRRIRRTGHHHRR